MVEQLQELSGAHAGLLQGQLRASPTLGGITLPRDEGLRPSPGSTRAGKPVRIWQAHHRGRYKKQWDSKNGLMDLREMGRINNTRDGDSWLCIVQD